jgi:hypothetical protein
VILRLLTACAVVASLALVAPPAAPAEAAAPTLTLVPTLDPAYPLQVPTTGSTPIRFTVTSSEAVAVQATASWPPASTPSRSPSRSPGSPTPA